MASKNYLAQLVALFKSGGGAAATIGGPLGRAADAASVSSALSTEDVALLNSLIARFAVAGALADGAALPTTTIAGAANLLSNGTTLDLQRGNTEGVALVSAARTAAAQSAALINYNARGVLVYLNVSAASGTGGLTLRIEGLDPVSGTWKALNTAPTAIIAISIGTYLIYPGASAGNTAQTTNVPLPRTWRINVAVGDASSYTYSVGYALIN